MKTVVIFKAKYLARLLRIPRFYKPYAELKKYKDIHKGKRCFILANGPSLVMEDIDKLHGEITFGVNRLYSLFEDTEWRPTYYAMVDHLYPYPEAVRYFKTKLLDYVPFSNFCTDTLFLTDDIMPNLKDKPSMEKVKFVPVNREDRYVEIETNKFGFCGDIFKGCHDNNTIVNYCIALAYYMGIREIYLLGADCDYATPKPYFDGSKTYGQGGMAYDEELSVLDLARAVMYQGRLFRSYSFMKVQAEKYGFVIYNATRGGKLEIFERKNLDDVLLEEK